MREIEGIETVVAKLEPHWPAIDAHFDRENARFKSLFARDHDALGRVLKCHLIVEHYLDRFLETHYGIKDLDGARLSFFQKARLLPDAAAPAAFVKPGVLQLNSIRNRFGHDLAVEVGALEADKIDQVLRVARPTTQFVSVVDRVEAFTTVACTFLVVPPREIQEAFMEAFRDLRLNAV